MEESEDIKLNLSLIQILPAVKRRVNALKKLQLESLQLEAKFFIDIYNLECEYFKKFKTFYDKREKIISGTVEPTDEECKIDDLLPQEDDEEPNELLKEIGEKLSITDKQGCRGIPEFWLTIFKNVELTNDMIQADDEPILKHLSDVQLEMNSNNMGFVLKFIFAPNEYFTNTCLTKEYEMKCVPEENDPWSFEGPEIFKCKGCVIDWKKSMNVTVKTIRKRQRHKSGGAVRTVVKRVQNDSFFNFFNPPVVPDGGEIDEETQTLLTSDFEIGHYIKDKLIPHAVLYFTGEALEDEEFEDSEDESSESEMEDDDDEENDGDEDEDDDEDFRTPSPKNKSDGQTKGKANRKSKESSRTQQDCAQQ